MARARFWVESAGSLVTIQDHGRPGLLRYGVPASGPMDRSTFDVAVAALGNGETASAIEISTGGLTLDCLEGAVSFAVAGGGFLAAIDRITLGSWFVASLRAGQRLSIRPGPWGSWAYLAFAGNPRVRPWLGSKATHALSDFGGGRLEAGQSLEIEEAEVRDNRAGDLPCPVWCRPRSQIKIVLGPQERFFSQEAVDLLLSRPFTLTDSYDRMGVRLRGPLLRPLGPLDMPSEALSRGSIQVAGDGVATVLMADHQTTGGYPKIATVVSDQLDRLAQNRSRGKITFVSVTPAEAIVGLRTRHRIRQSFLRHLRAEPRQLAKKFEVVEDLEGATL